MPLHEPNKKCGKESRVLSVGNLPPDVDQPGIHKVFERYGRILGVKFAEEKGIKFAVISFIDTRTAVKAQSEENKIGDRILVSSFYIPGKPLREEFFEALNQRRRLDLQFKKEKEQISSCHHNVSSGQNDVHSDSKDSTFKQVNQASALNNSVSTILVTGLPECPAELCVRERLYFLFRKYGPVSAVKINFGPPPTSCVRFQSKEDALLAIDELNGKVDLWGSKLTLCLHDYQVTTDPDMSVEDDVVYCDKATRTLYAGNLPPNIQESDLRALFEIFGNIWLIDIKRHNNVTPYAFIYFGTIRSVARTMRIMNGQQFQRQTLKLGFGRGQPAKTLWLGGLPRCTDVQTLSEFTGISNSNILYDSEGREAVIVMPDVSAASSLVDCIRRKKLHGSRIEVDFAPKEFLNTSVFAQSIANRFPAISNDCFDLICKESRKRVLKDLSCADSNGSTSSVFTETIQSEVAVKQNQSDVSKESIVNSAFGDVDMRFDPKIMDKRAYTCVDHSVVKQPRLNGVDARNKGTVDLSSLVKPAVANISVCINEIRLLLDWMAIKVATCDIRPKNNVRLYETCGQYKWPPVLHVCCLANRVFCKCCCFRFLYGDRLFGRNVLKACTSNPILILDHPINVQSSKLYCVASFDQNFCRAPVKLPAYNVCILNEQQKKTKVRCYFLPGDNSLSMELKSLCDSHVSPSLSIAIIFAEL